MRRCKKRYLIGIFILLLVLLTVCSIGVRKGKDLCYFPVHAGDKMVDMAVSEYTACKALEAVKGADDLPQSMKEAICIVMQTDAWYRLQRNLPLYADRTDVRKTYGRKMLQEWIQTAKAVEDQLLVYHGEPIFAAWYGCGAGISSSAEELFGTELAYLKRMESFDMAADILQTVRYTKEELNRVLAAAGYACRKPQVCQRAESGAVKQVAVGEEVLTGIEFAQILELPSVIFTFQWKEDQLMVCCIGEGEPVGLSLYGAYQMAVQGKTAAEILNYFYPGSNLQKLRFAS